MLSGEIGATVSDNSLVCTGEGERREGVMRKGDREGEGTADEGE